MRQFLGKTQQLVLQGTVEGNELHVLVDGGQRLDKRITWDDKVIGLARQERLFQEHKVQPGAQFTYRSYEPTFNAVVTAKAIVKDYEMVDVLGKKQKLLRAEVTPEKIQNVQLPALTVWLDKDLLTVRSRVEMPGLGELVLVRTTEAMAKGAGAAAPANDILSIIRLNQRIDSPYEARSAVYQIRVKGDEHPETAFAQDDRQEAKNIRGDSFELHIHATSVPPRGTPEGKVGKEFLESCYFINSDAPEVRKHARLAVGRETDPWEKALRIARYVYQKVDKKNFTEAFATSDEVARTWEGDCTEHSVLSAAMCRAAGIPSRTALGLVYIDHRQRGPALGFHMWTEVFVRGQWLPIDATLGLDSVGATHLKITDHSWHDIQALTPLLPVVRVLDKLSVKVLRVNAD